MKFLSFSFKFIGLQFFLCLVVHADSSQFSDRLTVAVSQYPPYYDEYGRGIAEEIIRRAFATQGIDVSIVHMPPKRRAVALIQGRVDAHTPGRVQVPSEVANKFIYVDTFKFISGLFKYHREAESALPDPRYDFGALPNYKDGLNTDKSIKLLTQKGLENTKLLLFATYFRDANQMRQAKLNIVQIQNAEQMIKIVLQRNIDIFGSTFISGLLLTQNVAASKARAFEFIPLAISTASLAFTKDSDRGQYLAMRAEKGIQQIVESGEYFKIHESYWGEGNVPQEVLPQKNMHLGTKSFDRELFWQQRRNGAFRIVTDR